MAHRCCLKAELFVDVLADSEVPTFVISVQSWNRDALGIWWLISKRWDNFVKLEAPQLPNIPKNMTRNQATQLKPVFQEYNFKEYSLSP